MEEAPQLPRVVLYAERVLRGGLNDLEIIARQEAREAPGESELRGRRDRDENAEEDAWPARRG